MKIFITGHRGFIGRHLVEQLKNTHQLILLEHDLRDHAMVKKQLLDTDPDIIVHLAARTEVSDSYNEQASYFEVNHIGTVNLIESARSLKNLKNFVFASSMEVYGWQPIGDIIKIGKSPSVNGKFVSLDENTPTNPTSPYGLSKLACEQYLEYAKRVYNFPSTIIRQTNSYGRKDNSFFITEQVIYQMLTNPEKIHLGFGGSYRNFIYIDDLLDVWKLIIETPEKCVGETFCLGPDNGIQIKDFVEKIASLIGWNGEIVWNTKLPRPGEIYLLNSTNEKITNILGWTPRYTLDQGLNKTIQDWRVILENKLPFKKRD
jgi:nucleoside-diphosphate-sugar epimerase